MANGHICSEPLHLERRAVVNDHHVTNCYGAFMFCTVRLHRWTPLNVISLAETHQEEYWLVLSESTSQNRLFCLRGLDPIPHVLTGDIQSAMLGVDDPAHFGPPCGMLPGPRWGWGEASGGAKSLTFLNASSSVLSNCWSTSSLRHQLAALRLPSHKINVFWDHCNTDC